MNWRQQAECRDMPVRVFFTERGELYPWPAMQACNRCDVWEECLHDALKRRDTIDHGYRAGTTPRTRQRMLNDPVYLREFIIRRRVRRDCA